MFAIDISTFRRGKFYRNFSLHFCRNVVDAMEPDILTIKEVADYLKLTEKTAYRLVAEGELPGFKVGGSWRFRRDEIEKLTKSKAHTRKPAKRRVGV